jgi:ketosteroid isomerase-like protein
MAPVLDRQHVEDWLEDYERAWRTEGTALLGHLFTEDATYLLSPFDAAVAGLPAIAAMWDRERTGPDERFTMNSSLVAIDGDVAVARIGVRYEEPTPREYRDLWILRFAADGRCREFEEWPFWPGQPRAAPSS